MAARPQQPHRHEWQRTERLKDGVRVYLHTCILHEDSEGNTKPLLRPYDLEIVDASTKARVAQWNGGES